jgi:hypothetical protein
VKHAASVCRPAATVPPTVLQRPHNVSPIDSGAGCFQTRPVLARGCLFSELIMRLTHSRIVMMMCPTHTLAAGGAEPRTRMTAGCAGVWVLLCYCGCSAVLNTVFSTVGAALYSARVLAPPTLTQNTRVAHAHTRTPQTTPPCGRFVRKGINKA